MPQKTLRAVFTSRFAFKLRADLSNPRAGREALFGFRATGVSGCAMPQFRRVRARVAGHGHRLIGERVGLMGCRLMWAYARVFGASATASRIACTRLRSSAFPVPAMSN